MRERGLSQAWRAEKQYVVQRLMPSARSLDEDLELLPHAVLPDIFLQCPRSQCPFDAVFIGRCALRRDDAFGLGRPQPCVGVYGHGSAVCIRSARALV